MGYPRDAVTGEEVQCGFYFPDTGEHIRSREHVAKKLTKELDSMVEYYLAGDTISPPDWYISNRIRADELTIDDMFTIAYETGSMYWSEFDDGYE